MSAVVLAAWVGPSRVLAAAPPSTDETIDELEDADAEPEEDELAAEEPEEEEPEEEEPESEADADAEVEAEDAAGSSDADAAVEASDDAAPGLFEAAVSDAHAGTKTADESRVRTRRWNFDLSGYVRGDMFVGKVPDRSSAEIKAGYAELSAKFLVTREKHGNAVAEARVRAGYDGEQIRLTPDLREAYVNGYFGPVDIRLGHQIVVWGRADVFNPTNNITPHDLRIRSPIEDDRRVANVGLRTFLNFAPVRIEGVWMPLYSAVRLPPIELDEIVTREPDDFPDTNLSNGLGAGRFHLELPVFEMSASYTFGHALLPGWSLVGFDVGPEAAVRVTRKPYRHHVAGFDFSTAIGDILGIRGELAYRHPLAHAQRVYAPRPDIQYVVGLDREFGPVNIIGQYMGRYTFDWASDEPGERLDPSILENLEESDLESPIVVDEVTTALNDEIAWNNQILFSQLKEAQHLASLRIEWKALHETLSLSALGMVNFSTWEYMIYPKVSYKITDRMHVAAGGEIYVGPNGTLFGWIDETLSAGYVELRFSF